MNVLSISRRLAYVCVSLCVLASCSNTEQDTATVDKQAEAYFDVVFDQWLSRSPTFQTWLGIKTDYDKWDNLSESYAEETLAMHQRQLADLQKMDVSRMSEAVALSYRMMAEALQERIDAHQWRLYDYPVNQMFGWHSATASLLINQHTIASVADADAYISRLQGVSALYQQLVTGMKARQELGVIPPKFVFPMVIEDSQNLITGQPFNGDKASPVWADFTAKIAALDVAPEQKKTLMAAGKRAMLDHFKPGYEHLITYLGELEKHADDRAGAWKFPNGEQYYAAMLKKTTTTDLTAEQIHTLGLKEVARIQDEMLAIMEQVNFDGDLQAFFQFIRDDEGFYYTSDEAGRQAYLARTAEVIDAMTAKLDEAFITKPKSPLKVKRVEAFREKSAGKAFYQSPPADGSRPGIYYANLYNMKEMPKYQLEALVFHEGLPGHHMQLSFATELKGVPRFRKYGSYTAYIEGWGLYSEYLAKEMGFYEDPYSDFGRLVMELWRACRLVTDTGIHAKKWSREQAIDYLVQNTPNAERDSRRAIERYIVLPSQATAYKIGMIKIQELRESARSALGDKFSIREFHETVLQLGAVPLSILEEQIALWVEKKQAE